ncbi:MAG TPA: TonB-dependent receptor [Gemmatimonadales bacterium]|nr:TonB-dependent receptor [Gemmatimonadales bacterium]
MRLLFAAGLIILATLAIAPASRAAAERDTVVMHHDPRKYEVVVSATRTMRDPVQVPNATAVVQGDALRRTGARTLGEALQDVVGVDAGDGSDNGPHTPNIGMWGLKEFDALLVTVDGVPVGGPFNPELNEIPLDDVDRIEIVKGPQGTLYGVSAFAGMLQVFTRQDDGDRAHVTVGGGSWSERHASAAVRRTLAHGFTLRAWGELQRGDGFQDRTGHDLDRGRVSVARGLSHGSLGVDLDMWRDTQRWGSPRPFADGALDPAFAADANEAVRGARLDHHGLSAIGRMAWAFTDAMRFENTLGVTRDRQNQVRSFIFPDQADTITGFVPASGVALRPVETTAYEDARVVSRFALGGAHELVTGGAVTWGRTRAEGEGFDFAELPGDPSTIPSLGDIPPGDLRSFQDRRTFFGVYAHDEWTPVAAFTLSGGGRWDRANEKLHAQAQEQGPPPGPLETADDARTDRAWSGDIAALARLVPADAHGPLQDVNLYANWKSAFKPAAPNLSEAEGAEILDPEHTHSVEVGLKSRAFDRQIGLDLSWFLMNFDNIVVSTLDPATSEPMLVNAGRERFKGWEAALVFAPDALAGLSLKLGYARHDARYVRFAALNPDGVIEVSDGNRIELVPRDEVQAHLQLAMPSGYGVFGALRWAGSRPFDRDNVDFAPAYTETDAGAWATIRRVRVSVSGRNLGDDRHVVAESELTDMQFYLAAPRRIVAEAGYSF